MKLFRAEFGICNSKHGHQSECYCRRVESVDYPEIAASLITAKAAIAGMVPNLRLTRNSCERNRLVIRPTTAGGLVSFSPLGDPCFVAPSEAGALR